ncbi:hypothetical protein GGI12_001477 [Dipsacomyces acuminosporus]|nr:hypothetical protein GGI12_001477 [Dipsacomyces acuminosporus]
MRLIEKAAAVASASSGQGAGSSKQISEKPSKRDSISSVASTAASSSRVKKPERKARYVASRYMSSTTSQKTPTPRKPDSKATVAAPTPTTTATASTRTASTRTASTRTASTRTVAAAVAVANSANVRPGLRNSRPKPETQAARPMANQTSLRTRTASTRRVQSTDTTAKARAETKPAETPVSAAAALATSETPDKRTVAASSSSTNPAPLATSSEVSTQVHSRHKHSSNTDIYSTYIQWCLIEARSQMAFDEAKAAAVEELDRLACEAELAKQALMDEQRKLKLMREISALCGWLAENKQFLVDMCTQVSKVKASYTRFSDSLAQTTRAMPISGVYFDDCESLVRDLDEFVGAVSQCFPKSSPSVQSMFALAARLNQYYRSLQQEQMLLSECTRLKESLRLSTVMAVSKRFSASSVEKEF